MYEKFTSQIRKNRVLPQAVDKVTVADQKELSELIDQANFSNRFFDRDDADIVLLRLYKDREINESEFMSIYQFFLAKWQFAEAQQHNGKLIKDTDVSPQLIPILDASGELSEKANEFLQAKQEVFSGEIIQAVKKALMEAGKKTGGEGHFLYTSIRVPPYVCNTKEAALKHANLSNLASQNTPFAALLLDGEVLSLDSESLLQDGGMLIMPYGCMLDVIESLYPVETILPTPMLGVTGQATLEQMHSTNKHPVACFNRHVKRNLEAAHDVKGCLTIYLHDLGHVFFGNRLDSKQRKMLFNTWIPELRGMASELNSSNAAVSELINKYIEELNDFAADIIARGKRIAPWHLYIAQAVKVILQPSSGSVNDAPFASTPQDILAIHFFWRAIKQYGSELYNLTARSYISESKKIDGTLAVHIKLAKLLAGVHDDKPKVSGNQILSSYKPGLQRLQELLGEYANMSNELISAAEKLISERLWYSLTESNLISLIVEVFEVPFFHPYAPITGEQIKKLKQDTDSLLDNPSEITATWDKATGLVLVKQEKRHSSILNSASFLGNRPSVSRDDSEFKDASCGV